MTSIQKNPGSGGTVWQILACSELTDGPGACNSEPIGSVFYGERPGPGHGGDFRSDAEGDHRPPRARTGPHLDVAVRFPMTLTGFCEHVRVLERAGLVRRTRHGRENTLELRPEPLRDVARWVLKYEQFWNTRLDRLQQFFTTEKEKS